MFLGKIITRVLFGVPLLIQGGSAFAAELLWPSYWIQKKPVTVLQIVEPETNLPTNLVTLSTKQTFSATPSSLGSCYGTNTGLTLMVGGAALCIFSELYLKQKMPDGFKISSVTIPVRSITIVSGALAMTAGAGCLYFSQETSNSLKYGPVAAVFVAVVMENLRRSDVTIQQLPLFNSILAPSLTTK